MSINILDHNIKILEAELYELREALDANDNNPRTQGTISQKITEVTIKLEEQIEFKKQFDEMYRHENQKN